MRLRRLRSGTWAAVRLRRRSRLPSVRVEWAGRRVEVEGYPPRAAVRLGLRLIQAVDPR